LLLLINYTHHHILILLNTTPEHSFHSSIHITYTHVTLRHSSTFLQILYFATDWVIIIIFNFNLFRYLIIIIKIESFDYTLSLSLSSRSLSKTLLSLSEAARVEDRAVSISISIHDELSSPQFRLLILIIMWFSFWRSKDRFSLDQLRFQFSIAFIFLLIFLIATS
jgi:hypothetical protein